MVNSYGMGAIWLWTFTNGLGLKRGASEAEIKKAYRSLAKQLHPDRNKDNPNAAKRFGEVTQAYDLLSDKDKRAQYDRGEIDEDGNPKMPFGGGFGGYSRGAGGPQPGGTGRCRVRELQFWRRDAPISAICSKGLFGGSDWRGGPRRRRLRRLPPARAGPAEGRRRRLSA